MRNPLASPSSTNLGLLFARVPLGAMFVMAGFSKFAGGGVSAFVAGSRGYVPHYMPSWFGSVFLNALPYVEILVGAMLVLGILGRLGGFLASLLLASFLLAFHSVLDPRSPTPMPHTNTALLGVALLVFLAGPGQFSLDRAVWKKKGNGGGGGGDAGR
jgi:uncharacterized membrane protein YphA (DoxX/SURF4 family)